MSSVRVRTLENPEKLPKLKAEISQIRRLVNPKDKRWSAFNPSIAYAPNKGYAYSIRSSNYVILETGELHVTEGGKIRNQVWIAETDESLKVQNLRKINVPKEIVSTWRGIEDPKLFWRDGSWWFTGVMLETHTPVARLCLCKLNDTDTEVTEVVILDGPEPKKPEKNWMLPDLNPNPNFDFIYSPNGIVKGDQVIHTMNTNEKLTGLRGGTNLLEQSDGTYLAVMHRLWTKDTRHYIPTRMAYIGGHDKNYGHYFVRFDSNGSLVEMSSPFQFVSRGIEFAAGVTQMGDNFIVSFGKDDVSAHVAVVPKKTVFGMMTTF